MRRFKRLSPLAGFLILILTAAALGSGQSLNTTASRAATFTVVLRDQAPYFNPKRLRIPPGSTVVWENQGPALVHTIFMISREGELHSGSIRPGQSWRHTFSEQTGDTVVRASCEVHPYMYGMVLVGNPPDSLVRASEASVDSSDTGGATARILEFPLPVPNSVPDILAVDGDDNIWFTMGGGGVKNIDLPPLNKVGRLTLDGDFRAFTLPTEGSVPNGLTVSPEGIVYVTQFLGNKISRIDPKRQIIEDFDPPTVDAKPTGLALDAAGNLWFSETGADKIARLSPSGSITELPIPTRGGRPTGMVADLRGNVWFSQRDGGKIGCLRPDGSFIEYALPDPKAKPAGLALDSRGRVWFAEMRGNRIGVIEGDRLREYPLPHPHSGPFFPVVDDEDRVWFTETFGDRIGRLDPATGAIVEYDLPTQGGWPSGLALDSQGNLWFALQLANKIGVLVRSPDGLQPPHIMPATTSK